MAGVARETFNGGDALPCQSRRRSHAGPNWMPVHQDGTRSAHGNTAAELRARQMEDVAQYPEQWNVRRGCDYVRFAVDLKRNACHICPRRFLLTPGFSEPRHVGRPTPCHNSRRRGPARQLGPKECQRNFTRISWRVRQIHRAIADEERRAESLSLDQPRLGRILAPRSYRKSPPHVAFSRRLPISSVEGKEGKSNDDNTSKCR